MILLEVTLACDIIMNLRGPVRPAFYLAQGLINEGYEVSILAPKISTSMKNLLNAKGITPIELSRLFIFEKLGGFPLWFEAWTHGAFLRFLSKRYRGSSVLVNFSHTLCIPSSYWYLQGPTFAALRDTEVEFDKKYKIGHKIMAPLLEYADKKLIKKTREKTVFAIANSHFCASLYREIGIEVSRIIYPPINTEIFHPLTSNPSSNYVLTYFGRETRFNVIRTLADLGITFIAFGSSWCTPRHLMRHPNIKFLGEISTKELVHLYSNALFTLFAFTHEPFGYIPVESMACGTPVLTYNKQGPKESVIDGYSGWLVKRDHEIISKALDIWNNGYHFSMRVNSVKTAQKFDKKLYIRKWMEILYTHGL